MFKRVKDFIKEKAFSSEKRQRIRSHYVTDVFLKTDNHQIKESMSCDISLNGVFLKTKEKFPLNKDCIIEIKLLGVEPEIILKLNGKIVRVTTYGIGITFEQMDIESFNHLRQIVLTNADEPDKVIKECDEKPGFK